MTFLVIIIVADLKLHHKEQDSVYNWKNLLCDSEGAQKYISSSAKVNHSNNTPLSKDWTGSFAFDPQPSSNEVED